MPGLAVRVIRDPTGAAVVAFLGLLVAAALLAPWLAPYDPVSNDLSGALAGPSGAHWLGTDELGRDVASRLLFGARISLTAAVLAAAVAVTIGLPTGLAAGYLGGRADRALMRASDALQSMPGLIIILAVVAAAGTTAGVVPAMTTLGVLLSPMILRIVRAAAIQVRQEAFVAAARVIGLPHATIMRRHLLPHVLPPLLVQASLVLGIGLLAEAGLSFIGVGVQAPQPSWGAMLARANRYLSQSPGLLLPPGLAITATVLALNLLGDVIRDHLGRGLDHPTDGGRRTRSPRPAAAAAGADPVVPAAPPADQRRPLLQVRDLTIAFPDPAEGTIVDVVTSVSFGLDRGETVGLVGESGCGKSVTARAMLGLVPAPGQITGGSIRLDGGQELVGAPARRLRQVRGRRIAMIFQDPLSALDPAFTVGDQIAEAARAHHRLSRAQARARAVTLLEQIGIAQAHRRVRAYPHELSGGQAQRAMIAAALASDPDLLIADEPTTALDVTVQAEILDLLRCLQAERGMAILLVSHDLAVIADLCHRVMIMYAGQLAEAAGAADLYRRPRHPYTAALLAAVLRNTPRTGRLAAIGGAVPHPRDWPTGCRFAPRCAHALDACRAAPVALEPSPTGLVRCIRAHELTNQHPGGLP